MCDPTLRGPYGFADWIRDVEPYALGELQLSPQAFGRMTPREVRLRSEGWQRAEERQAKRIIWLIQHRYKKVLEAKHILRGRPMRSRW